MNPHPTATFMSPHGSITLFKLIDEEEQNRLTDMKLIWQIDIIMNTKFYTVNKYNDKKTSLKNEVLMFNLNYSLSKSNDFTSIS